MALITLIMILMGLVSQYSMAIWRSCILLWFETWKKESKFYKIMPIGLLINASGLGKLW